MRMGAIPQVEIDKILVRDSRIFGQPLEIFDNIHAEAKCDLLLQFCGIRVLASLHL